MHLADGVPAKSAITWAQGVPVELPGWFEQAMRTEFIFGSVLYDAHPELAISQFGWLKNWTGYNAEVLGIFLQSSALLALLTAQVKATENGTTFVPYLSRTVYGELARAYVDEARQYESDYRALQTQRVVDEHFIALAKTLLANKTYESEYATELLAQAKRNFDHAVAATEKAEKTLTDAQSRAQLVAIDFEKIGVPAWKREQIVKAVIDIGTSVVTFAVRHRRDVRRRSGRRRGGGGRRDRRRQGGREGRRQGAKSPPWQNSWPRRWRSSRRSPRQWPRCTSWPRP